ncbi:MAG: signal peptidase I [Candidatus Binatia bacterium]
MPAESQRAVAAIPARRESAVSAARQRPKSLFREYGEALFVALLLALFIRSFIVQAFKIPSGSMIPTLQIGDHILVNKFIYGVRMPYFGNQILELGTPRRGDVVVFIYPQDEDKDFIKRVVAVGGDTVEVRSKRLYVNGQPADDPHAHFAERSDGRFVSPRDNFGPQTIAPGHIFVMGDNRDRSYDGRFWGSVKLDKVKGKAFLIYWSWDSDQHWLRWRRLGNYIP